MLKIAAVAAAGAIALAAAASPRVANLPAIAALSPTSAAPEHASDRAAAPRRAHRAIPAALEWRIEPAGERAAPGEVSFSLGWRAGGSISNTQRTLPLAALSGLSADALAAPGAPAGFTLVRDAGRFRCSGVAGQGRGAGTCAYAPDPGFPAALAARGVAAPSPFEQFALAYNDVGLAYVDSLARLDYATPAPGELVRAGEHGADMAQLTGLARHGYRLGTVSALVRATDHGVTPAYVAALAAHGWTRLPTDTLVRLKDHGVSPQYLAAIRAAGYADLTPVEMVEMKDHGVSPAFVAELARLGYAGLSAGDLVRMADHGVTPGFIRAANGAGRRPVDELVRLRDQGAFAQAD